MGGPAASSAAAPTAAPAGAPGQAPTAPVAGPLDSERALAAGGRPGSGTSPSGDRGTEIGGPSRVDTGPGGGTKVGQHQAQDLFPQL